MKEISLTTCLNTTKKFRLICYALTELPSSTCLKTTYNSLQMNLFSITTYFKCDTGYIFSLHSLSKQFMPRGLMKTIPHQIKLDLNANFPVLYTCVL